LSLPLLIDGIDYPGVQVTGVNFNQNTGFDIGNFDINPFDNISYDAAGRPTYDLGILDAIYASYYGLPITDPVTGPVPPYPPLSTDINVNGGAYVDTYSSHAPEELVPGAEFDTLDLRVYTRPGSDWELDGHGFPETVRNYVFDSTEPTISFAGIVTYPVQVVVYNQTTGLELDQTYACTVDWANQEITINSGAITGQVIDVSVYEIGGGNQLFKQVYNGADVGNTLVIPVEFSEIQELAVFVNGVLDTNYTYVPEWEEPGVTVTYNPLGSSGTTLVVTDTLDIVVGSVITGTGFTSNQTVVSKQNETTLLISAAPDSSPSGNLTFKANTKQTKITFSTTYTSTDFLNVTAIGSTDVNGTPVDYGWSAPQTQIIVADGSSLVYDLDNSLAFSNPDCLIVTVNGIRARTSAGAEYIGDGSTAYLLPQRLGFDSSTIADSEVAVYVDGTPQVLNVDFYLESVIPGDPREVIFFTAPSIGSQIQVYVRTGVQCFVSGGQLFFVSGSGLEPILGDVIAVTTWNDTRQQNILPLVFVGPVTTGLTVTQPYDSTLFDNPPGLASTTPGSFDSTVGTTVTVNDLQLGRPVTDPDRLWITLNGIRQFPGVDFVLSGEEVILHSGVLSGTDVVMITMFTESVVPAAMAFRIFQDMRGVQAVYRITPDTTTTLVEPLTQDDDVIYVEDASALSWPDIEANIWGVVMINGERIMYRDRDTTNNTISSLLRGTAGTGAADHPAGATVTDMGRENLLPEQYQNYILSGSTLADGSTVTFEAEDINLLLEDSTIRDESVEVYVGGTRVQSGYTVSNDNPCQVTFDTAPPDGVEVTILVRRGVTWYAPGAGTPSDGRPLQQTNTQAARFLRGLN
jgi:hypothetical protein